MSIVLHCDWAVGGILAILFSTTSFCVVVDSYSGNAVQNSYCIRVANSKKFLNKKTSVFMEILWLTVGNIISIFSPVVNRYRLLVGRKSVVVKKDGEFVIFYACGDTITLLLHLSLPYNCLSCLMDGISFLFEIVSLILLMLYLHRRILYYCYYLRLRKILCVAGLTTVACCLIEVL